MYKSLLPSLLAITLVAASLAGCEEALMAVDPNRFDLKCDGETEVRKKYIDVLNEVGSDKTRLEETTETRSIHLSVDLEKMLWCARNPDKCLRIEGIISVDRYSITLDPDDVWLDRERGDLTLRNADFYDDSNYKGEVGDLIYQLESGTLKCERRAFTKMENNRKF